jgi:SOS-response transcriptional repressor LexA
MFDNRVEALKAFYQKHKRLPSYAEMMPLFGYKSKGGVIKFVDKLLEAGIVGREQGKLFPIALSGVRQLGSVKAGFPGMAEQLNHETMSFDEWLVRDPLATYILSVDGDSMQDAGIYAGDYVVVEMTRTFRDGDIVIAEIDGDWTMKYLRHKQGVQYLEAANEAYPDLYPETELKLHAKVVGVVRRYD